MFRLACLLAVAGAASAQLTLDGIRCGQLTCQLDEYCSLETNRCAPCNVVCNKTHHNYDGGLCIKVCQGYLMDLRYMRKSEDDGVSADYSGIQRQARAALIVSGVALAVLLIVLVIVCRNKFSWRYIKQKFQPPKVRITYGDCCLKKPTLSEDSEVFKRSTILASSFPAVPLNRVKQYPVGLTHHNPHAEMPKTKELKLEIRNPEPPQRHNQQPLNPRDLETRTSQTEKSQGATTPKTISTALSNRHPAEDTTLDYSYDNMAMNVTPPEQPAPSHRF